MNDCRERLEQRRQFPLFFAIFYESEKNFIGAFSFFRLRKKVKSWRKGKGKRSKKSKLQSVILSFPGSCLYLGGDCELEILSNLHYFLPPEIRFCQPPNPIFQRSNERGGKKVSRQKLDDVRYSWCQLRSPRVKLRMQTPK